MRVPYAWNNTFQNKKRTLAAVGGIAFSVLLIFMQLGFLETGRRGATLLYEYLDFDLIITSDQYEFFARSPKIDKARLIQAQIVPGVADVMALNISDGAWVDPATETTSGVMLIGVETNPAFISVPEIRANLDALSRPKTVMVDILSTDDYGPLTLNRSAKINGTDVTVGALFALGMRFYNEGAVFVSNQTFQSLERKDARMVSFGLVKLSPGADAEKVIAELKESLPRDVLIMGREELLSHEQRYFLFVIPVGIMFLVGVVIAFAIGSVILFQVLATEITNKLTEFATLKAMGFSNRTIYAIGFKQALMFAFMGYIPAMAITYGLFQFLKIKAKLPAEFTPQLAGTVLLITLIMCSISGFLALQTVRKADPVELF